MGAHSTLQITREKALELYDHAAFKDGSIPCSAGVPSDRFLEGWLDEVLYDKLYNAEIVNEEDISDMYSGMWLSPEYLED